MTINRHDLERMNDLIGKGATIADIAKKFRKYDYWEIYWEVEDYSLLGKKRSITNRLNKLRKTISRETPEGGKINEGSKKLNSNRLDFNFRCLYL
jgi:hypothetical protein